MTLAALSFVVDDNFIGNKRNVKLCYVNSVLGWQNTGTLPPLNQPGLSTGSELLDLMVAANFTASLGRDTGHETA